MEKEYKELVKLHKEYQKKEDLFIKKLAKDYDLNRLMIIDDVYDAIINAKTVRVLKKILKQTVDEEDSDWY